MDIFCIHRFGVSSEVWDIIDGYDPDHLAKDIPDLAGFTVVNEIPDLSTVWIDIAPGQVTLDKYGTTSVRQFSIAKYPVTVAMYKVFMQDGGYTTEHWWIKEGWQWVKENGYTTPRYWGDKDWESLWKLDHPIVGVSWFEAEAFARWLSDKLGGNITLPTAPQWLRAAQGDDVYSYPWGSVWDSNRCNNNVDDRDWEKRRNRGLTTSPVTTYENKGDSYFGVTDMAGNVWEWTSSDYHVSESVALDFMNSNCIVCGGSWVISEVEGFQISSRYGSSRISRNEYLGFRVVLSSQEILMPGG